MSHEILSADALLRENAELRRALDVAMIENDAHQAQNAALVRELVYARAFIREIRGAMLIGGWRDQQSAALAAYDKAVQP
jgi:hypothetical protein